MASENCFKNGTDIKMVLFDHVFFFLIVSLQAFHSIAKCVAALTISCASEGSVVVNRFVSDVKVRVIICMSTSIFLIVSPKTTKGLQFLVSVCVGSDPCVGSNPCVGSDPCLSLSSSKPLESE